MNSKSLPLWLLPGMLIPFNLALAQIAPISGDPVLNQGLASAPITPTNGVTFPATRDIFIGSASACTLAMKLKNDKNIVTWYLTTPGQLLAVSAVDIESTSTTCTNIVGIW